MYFCSSSVDADVATGKRLLLGSCIIVLLQLAAVVGCIRNTATSACSTNDHCPQKGMYCEVFRHNPENVQLFRASTWKQAARCGYCGRLSPVPIHIDTSTGEVWNRSPNDQKKNPFADDPDNSWFINSGRIEAGQDVWRRDWPDYGPVNLLPGSASSGDDTNVVQGLVDRGYSWPAVVWTCKNPGGNATQQIQEPDLYPQGPGLSANGNSPQVEAARTPLALEYVQNWCDSCVHIASEHVDEFREIDRVEENRKAMSSYDFSTLLLAAVFLALAAIGELKDIMLCNIAVVRALAEATLSGAEKQSNTSGISPGLGRAFKLISMMRERVILPGLIGAVCCLVIQMGGDGASLTV